MQDSFICFIGAKKGVALHLSPGGQMLIQKIMENKEFMTSKEAAAYLGVKVSFIHKLTFRKQIPYYKPNGKMCFFKREDLCKWVMQNRVATDEELTNKAQEYCNKKGGLK